MMSDRTLKDEAYAEPNDSRSENVSNLIGIVQRPYKQKTQNRDFVTPGRLPKDG